MLKLNYINKKKAFLLVQTIILIFLFICVVGMIQFILTSSFNSYKLDEKNFYSSQKILFMDTILNEEFKIIETKINDSSIEDAVKYFSYSSEGKEIFSYRNFKDRISLGGYRLLNDEVNIDYYDKLNNKIILSFRNSYSIHYKKEIIVDDKKYFIKVTVKYEIGDKKNVESLKNPIIERMWIHEADKENYKSGVS